MSESTSPQDSEQQQKRSEHKRTKKLPRCKAQVAEAQEKANEKRPSTERKVTKCHKMMPKRRSTITEETDVPRCRKKRKCKSRTADHSGSRKERIRASFLSSPTMRLTNKRVPGKMRPRRTIYFTAARNRCTGRANKTDAAREKQADAIMKTSKQAASRQSPIRGS